MKSEEIGSGWHKNIVEVSDVLKLKFRQTGDNPVHRKVTMSLPGFVANAASAVSDSAFEHDRRQYFHFLVVLVWDIDSINKVLVVEQTKPYLLNCPSVGLKPLL